MLAVVMVVVGMFQAAPVARHFSAAPDCREWTECRRLALEAAEREDYETFHDLAWRTVQLGPKDDPALLFVLARAQSLSGRPHDALVMLRRLGPGGVARDSVASPEFERVRALREWPEVAALLSGSPEAREPEGPRGREPEGPGARKPEGPGARKPEGPGGRKAESPAPEPTAGAEALTFDAASFNPAALAYDAVSRRFIISDTDVSRLAVIDEFSHHLATLASGQAAGFGTVTAIAIDPRAGDLWVASFDGSSGDDVPALHKLQLISGRVLKKVPSESRSAGPFVDIAVAPDGTVYAVQQAGVVWRLPAGGSSLAPTHRVTHGRFASVTVSSQGALYIASGEGVMRFTPAPGADLKAPDGVDLSGLIRIRWSRGSLIALQRAADGSHRVLRIRLARDGRSVTAVDVLDASVNTPNPAAATLAGDVFYYLAQTSGAELAIRKVIVR